MSYLYSRCQPRKDQTLQHMVHLDILPFEEFLQNRVTSNLEEKGKKIKVPKCALIAELGST